jgi:hypothetical protein
MSSSIGSAIRKEFRGDAYSKPELHPRLVSDYQMHKEIRSRRKVDERASLIRHPLLSVAGNRLPQEQYQKAI